MERTPLRGCAAAAVAAVLAVLLAAACTVGPSQRPPVAVRGQSVPAPAAAPTAPPAAPPQLPAPQPQHTTIPFVDCTADTYSTMLAPPPADRSLRIECGSLEVPADPAAPGAGTTSLTVMRVGLTGAPADLPPLAIVGDSAVDASARAAVTMAGRVPPDLLGRFALIGIDRRGFGTDPLDCAPADARDGLVDADPNATDEASLTQLLDRARAVVQECNLSLDGGLAPYRTSSTSSDLEILRNALGVDRLSAVGTGDGAAAVSGWVRAAPQSAGRVVLDGPPAPGIDDPDLADSRAKSAEAAFDAFATACRGGPACPLGADPRRTVGDLLTTLRGAPLGDPNGSRLTAGAALLALRLGLSEPLGWPALASALAAARKGDPGPMLDSLELVLGPRGSYDGMLATACNDSRRRLAPADISKAADRMRAAYPLFGGSMALQMVACAPWSTGGQPPPPGPGAAPPPLLIIGTAADPRSTLDGARRVADETPGSAFVSWQGAGTGAYPRTACVTATIDGVLVDGNMPGPTKLCPP